MPAAIVPLWQLQLVRDVPQRALLLGCWAQPARQKRGPAGLTQPKSPMGPSSSSTGNVAAKSLERLGGGEEGTRRGAWGCGKHCGPLPRRSVGARRPQGGCAAHHAE